MKLLKLLNRKRSDIIILEKRCNKCGTKIEIPSNSIYNGKCNRCNSSKRKQLFIN